MVPASEPAELITVFAQLHGMFVSEQDASTAVDKLAQAIHLAVPSAVGAGVSLFHEDGSRSSTAATDAVVEETDNLQYSLGQGPCISAWITGESQRVDDTLDDSRWTQWQAAAAEAGIRSCLSVPLVYRTRAVGALKVYATTPDAFGEPDEIFLRLFADAIATLQGVAQPTDGPVRLSKTLQESLGKRDRVALARGILIAMDGLSHEEAQEALLERSRAERRTLAEVAAEVITGVRRNEGDRTE